MNEKVSLEQFIAEIESAFSNYSESHDIDRITIKTKVIECLREFGKNICDKNETVVEVKNKRALLPETFKSATVLLKVSTEPFEEKKDKELVTEKKYFENPAIWDSVTQEYVVNYCQTKLVTEKIYSKGSSENKYYGVEILSLTPYVNKNSFDVDCLNLHPSIRNEYPNQVSINNRTLTTNFKNGLVYVKYNSLPTIDDEVAIPIISTGDIYKYIENAVKIRVGEDLILKNKNPQGIKELIPLWLQRDRDLKHAAQTEAKFGGLNNGWERRMYKQNLINRNRFRIK